MKKKQLIWDEWWQSLNVVERFRLMKKHNILKVNSKLIKRMYISENDIHKEKEN